MKIKFLLFIIAILGLGQVSGAHGLNNNRQSLPAHLQNLPLDLTGSEYLQLMENTEAPYRFFNMIEPRLARIDAIGVRNLNWLKKLNELRPAGQKISLTAPETAQAFPMDHPRTYNTDIIAKGFDVLWAQVPTHIKDVLESNADLPATLPLTEKEYIHWGLEIDRSYQMSLRWQMYQPYLWSVADRINAEVRGYLFFNRQTSAEMDRLLNHFDELTGEQQDQVKQALIQMCYNSILNDVAQNLGTCNTTFTRKQTAHLLQTWYSELLQRSKENYDTFFLIPSEVRRQDANWKSNQLFLVDFQRPDLSAVEKYLSLNIQDEWHWLDWALHLNMLPSADVHIEFKAGVTPHVNELGGNTITMDANAPIEEYEVQWAIRHEFGHILGFPDCYLEYYDTNLRAMVSYQIDTTDLMCSRQGHLHQRHFDELKRIYKN